MIFSIKKLRRRLIQIFYYVEVLHSYLPAGDRPQLRLAQLVLGLADFDTGFEIARRGLVHDFSPTDQRGPSVAGAATLAQRSRRHCEPGHMSLLSSSVVMTR